MLKNIGLAFIPIFVAIDAIGVLPLFAGLTTGMRRPDKNKIIIESVVTALLLTLLFLFLGKAVFRAMGVTIPDFMIAGGGVLFCIAILDLISPAKIRRKPVKQVGAVPIGTPLIAGPAVLTTTIMMVDAYGIYATLAAVLLNICIVAVVFWQSEILIKVLGQAGSMALSKVTSLLLAAIAVMMVRKAVLAIIFSEFS